jgi:hypothetical protein
MPDNSLATPVMPNCSECGGATESCSQSKCSACQTVIAEVERLYPSN